MKRPKKKEYIPLNIEISHPNEAIRLNKIAFGYNQACDDWEKYHEACREQWLRAYEIKMFTCIELPSEEEIFKLIGHAWVEDNKTARAIAKAISKRIRGEK